MPKSIVRLRRAGDNHVLEASPNGGDEFMTLATLGPDLDLIVEREGEVVRISGFADQTLILQAVPLLGGN